VKVLFLAGREISYTRNDVLLRAFQRFCEVELLASKQRPTSLALNSACLLPKAIMKLLSGKFDLIFIGFYGHLLMLFPFRVLFRKPVVFDAFTSTYDTLIGDRKKGKPGSLLARLALAVDQIACRNADIVLVDTPQQIDFFRQFLDISLDMLKSIPVGCNEDLFTTRNSYKAHQGIRILYYSTYLPLHGVDVVIKAAFLLKEEPVYFRLIGSGPTFKEVRNLAEKFLLSNIEFLPDVSLKDLADEIAQADICLGGHFGNSEKAMRVIPGKVYQILAMAKPVIASNTPANLGLLRHLENAYLCSPGDPIGLADAIKVLHRDTNLRERLAQVGYQMYIRCCSESVITRMLEQIVNEIVPGN
jgi:glycosyltransferase involved in cell wall biosynthesis